MEGVLYKGDLFLLLRYHRGGFRIVFKRAKMLFESIADGCSHVTEKGEDENYVPQGCYTG